MEIIQKKICLLGDFAVGKTSLIRRFVNNEFSEKYLTTIGVHITKREVILNDSQVNLVIWDLAGDDLLHNITEKYLKGASGFVIAADLTRENTIANINKHIEMLANENYQIPMVIALTKNDLLDEITSSEEIIKRNGVSADYPVFSTSSKTGENVENMFSKLSKLLLEHR